MHATNTRLPSTQHGQIATSSSPDTHQPKTSARLSTPASGTAKRQGASVKEALKALCIDLTSLKQSRSPQLSDIVSTCEKLKSYEDWLKQARQVPNVHTELQQLRALLPAFFSLIDRCLAIHQDIALDADALQALCLGLSALAPPMPGPFLTEAQCSAARPVLTAISLKLAAQLAAQFAHTDADAGRLLNCLNWYGRALKADLLLKNQPGVNAVSYRSRTNPTVVRSPACRSAEQPSARQVHGPAQHHDPTAAHRYRPVQRSRSSQP